MTAAFVLNLFLIQLSFTTITSVTYSCWSNSTCGCSLNSAVLTRIIGGEQAEVDTWGWAISIRVQNYHVCGGSLISSTLVLTAAHCLNSVSSVSKISINAGSKYLSVINQQRSIAAVYIHRNYESSTFSNDLAVLRLSSPLDMNDRSLASICLPPTNETYPPKDTTVVAIGWGVLLAGDRASSNALQQVTLETIANTATICKQSINNERLQFCAGVQGGGKDTCQGDSGGPLMLFSNGQWQLVGITSYGRGCALPGNAGVYTRVSTYGYSISCFLKNNTVCIKNMFIIRDSIASSIFDINYFFIFFSFVIIQFVV